MHMLQACVPHRRDAARRGASAHRLAGRKCAAPSRSARSGRPAAGGLDGDCHGRGRAHRGGPAGLRLRGVGAARGDRALAPSAPRGGAGAGGGARPRSRPPVTLSCGQPGRGPRRAAAAGWRAVAGRADRYRDAGRLRADRAGQQAGGLLLGSGGWRRPGQTLSRSPRRCEPRSAAEPRAGPAAARPPGGAAGARQLRRLRAIAACLAAAGRETSGGPVTLAEAGEAGWVQVRAGAATMACTVTALDGVAQPVTIALATWPAPACRGKPIPAAGAGYRSGRARHRCRGAQR